MMTPVEIQHADPFYRLVEEVAEPSRRSYIIDYPREETTAP
jgi:hypothetical protein